jgi:hypothetical protein
MNMKYLVLLFCFLIFTGAQAVAAEEIAHTVVSSNGNIEIREYAETVKAVVTVKGTRREAANKAFRTLFNFISGDNIADKKIAMTAPVSQQAQSQKIPMTTPVAQVQAGEGQWAIAFYMPNDMDFENTPKPTNENIQIERIPDQKKAAIQFSGFWSDDNIAKHEQALIAYLEKNNIDYIPQPTYAFYNGPWTPWFMRHNEILFNLK